MLSDTGVGVDWGIEVHRMALCACAESEQFLQLRIRGGEALENMIEGDMRKMTGYIPGFFDAIMPILKEEPYTLGMRELITNLFEIRTMTPYIFSHKVTWQPAAVGNKTADTQWRTKAFWNFNEEANRTWAAQGYTSALGLGVWDRGEHCYRNEQIHPNLTKQFTVRTCLPCYPNHYRRHTDVLRLDIVDHDPGLWAKQLNWADQALFRQTGAPDAPWVKLRNAVGAILQAYYLRFHTDFIEDFRKSRLFYQGGYPDANDERKRFVVDSENNPACKMYVIRRGARFACRVLAAGIFVNVYTASSCFWYKNITVADVMITVAKASHLKWNGQRPLNRNELKLMEKNLRWLRVCSTLCTIPAELRQRIPIRYYKIYGLSEEPCKNVRVPRLHRVGRKLQRVPNTNLVHFYTLMETRYGLNAFDGRLIDPKLSNYPAVKVHPTDEWYLPPWALIIKEGEKFPLKRSDLGNYASLNLRKLRKNELIQQRFADLKAQIEYRINK